MTPRGRIFLENNPGSVGVKQIPVRRHKRVEASSRKLSSLRKIQEIDEEQEENDQDV